MAWAHRRDGGFFHAAAPLPAFQPLSLAGLRAPRVAVAAYAASWSARVGEHFTSTPSADPAVLRTVGVAKLRLDTVRYPCPHRGSGATSRGPRHRRLRQRLGGLRQAEACQVAA